MRSPLDIPTPDQVREILARSLARTVRPLGKLPWADAGKARKARVGPNTAPLKPAKAKRVLSHAERRKARWAVILKVLQASPTPRTASSVANFIRTSPKSTERDLRGMFSEGMVDAKRVRNKTGREALAYFAKG